MGQALYKPETVCEVPRDMSSGEGSLRPDPGAAVYVAQGSPLKLSLPQLPHVSVG